jgi:hypothetical protein
MKNDFSFLLSVQFGVRTHTASYPMVPGALNVRLKRPGLKVYHSPPSSAEAKNEWSYPIIPLTITDVLKDDFI